MDQLIHGHHQLFHHNKNFQILIVKLCHQLDVVNVIIDIIIINQLKNVSKLIQIVLPGII